MHRRCSFFKEVLDESFHRIARLWKVLSREKRRWWYQVRASPHCWWYGIVSHHTDKWVIDMWVESLTQLGTGSWHSSTEVREHRNTSEHCVEPGSCHFVWTLGSCCLFPGSPETEGKLLCLILYFGIHSFPWGFLHFLFLKVSQMFSCHKEISSSENSWGDDVLMNKYLVCSLYPEEPAGQ